MSPFKFFLYTRKSTDTEDRQVYSIEHQIAELRELASKKNLDVVAEFTENRTAKMPGRPVFNDMLTRIKKGEASGILTWSPDRLARNSVDGGQIIHLLDTGAIRDLQFPTHMFEATSAGKLMLSVLFGMSKYFTDSLSDNIKRAIRQRIQNGNWPRRPSLGYLFDRNTRTVVIDAQRAQLIRKVFDLYSTGTYAFDKLAQTVNAMGLRGFPSKHHPPLPLSPSQYQLILQNPFYTGLMRLNGELYEGKHEPLISNHLFETCRRVMVQRAHHKTPIRLPFLYRKMFTCAECGCAITMEIQKGHTYVHCTKRKGPCSQPYLRAESVAKQITAIVKTLVIPPDVGDWMVTQLKEEEKKEAMSWATEVRSVQKTLAGFEIKFQRLTDAYVDGTMPAVEYKKTKEKLLTQKRSLADKLTFIQNNRNTRFEPAIRFIRGSTEAQKIAEGENHLAQRDFLQKAGSNFQMKSGRVVWEARGAWKHVADAGFSGKRVVATPVTLTTADAKNPNLCPEPLGVRTLVKSITTLFRENPAVV